LNPSFNINFKRSIFQFGIFFWFLIAPEKSYSQNPASFHITTEEGLPSNEVYSLLIDQKGFLWAATDAGICKYDGVNFISYSSPAQRTKSLSGLCAAPDGRIYCYSFNGQLFYAENDSLFALKNWNKQVANLTCDASGKLWIASTDGIYSYDALADKFTGPLSPDSSESNIARGIIAISDTVYSLFECGLTGFSNGKEFVYRSNQPLEKLTGLYVVQQGTYLPWIISAQDEEIYRPTGRSYSRENSSILKESLKSKKVTNIRQFDNQKIWICTYDGLVIYDFVNDQASLFFNGIVLSDVTFDREGNCWLSSLHQGLFRVPNLNTPLWDFSKNDEQLNTPIKLIQYHQMIFYYTTLGDYGAFDLETHTYQIFSTSFDADIQSIYFDSIDQLLYLFTNNHLYTFSKNTLKELSPLFPPVKDLIRFSNGYILATSIGTFYHSSLESSYPTQILDETWSREICYFEKEKTLFLATNNGVLVFEFLRDTWVRKYHLLNNIQILSIASSNKKYPVYAVTFDGKIYEIDAAGTATFLTNAPKKLVPNDLFLEEEFLYLGSNSGLFIFDLNAKTWTGLTRYSGLASNDIQSVLSIDHSLWLATGKGLQAIPKKLSAERKTGYIYLNDLFCDNVKVNPKQELVLNYDQSLSFTLEAAHYSSDENFKYAYRLPLIDSSWNTVPATSKKITIPSIPSGEFSIEIKFVDYLGNDSENFIELHGKVIPPFWQRWWYYLLIVLAGVLFAYFLARYRIGKLKERQIAELRKMRLENELRLSQQIALKAQMNPHFIFNVLNSIKAYIYENDKKKAAAYLGDFSDLVRRILTMSAQTSVRLSEEMEALSSYIRLEQMMLEGNFIYEEKISPDLELSVIRIPVLVIQPFVENAFQHGLRHKLGEKKLTLSIYYESQKSVLVIELVDNGIGRIKSQEINAKNRQNHKSFAVEYSSKRIELINREKSNLVGVEIRDLHDAAKEPSGTCVIIKIQING